jgi:hypothetical protein
LGLTKVGKQAKPLSYSEKKQKVVFLTNLEQNCSNFVPMSKITATDLDTQPITKQGGLTCALKNVRLLPDGYYCLNFKENEILFRNNISPTLTAIRINISPTLTAITGLDGASQWLGLPGHRTSHQWTSFYVATLKP